METRDEIKKRMEESLKGCKIINKQETPKTKKGECYSCYRNESNDYH